MSKTYVEKYVEHRYNSGEKLYGVRHTRTNECKAGFDSTTFDSKEDFQKVMRKHNMEYRRIERADGRYFYTWSNPEVMLVTAWNPVSGRKDDGSKLHRGAGQASYMGVQGDCQAVKQLSNDLYDAARHVKAYNPKERAFI